MTNGKPNLLLLIPNLGRGGAQRVFHQHREFFSDDYNVVSCVFNFDGAFSNELNENIISLDVPGGGSIFSKVANFFKRVNRLKKFKRDHKIDVTISHLEGADYVNVLSRQKDKVVLWIHGTKIHDKEIKGIVGLFRQLVLLPRLYRQADKIVCVSLGIADELKSIVPRVSEDIITVQNGIDISLIREKSMEPLRSEWQEIMSKYFVVVTHCRFAPQKNLRALLYIIAELKDLDNVRFVVLGDGEQREGLQQLTLKLGIGDRIFFPGQQSNPFSWLRQSKLYVLTSLWEGYPLALCEAIACGLPIVAADCYTGPKEILAASNAGVLAPLVHEELKISVDAWSTILRKLISDQSALDGYRSNANENAEKFSSVTSKRDTLSVIKEVLK